MAKKIRRVRTFARTATKTQEKLLIDNAKKLYENPTVILPETTDSICQKYLNQLEKKINRIYRYKDDQDKLEKLANKKGIEGAFAGTLFLAISEKAPYLGVLKLPTGDITYAQRGRADREKLIGIQHHTDPVLRLLSLKDLAFKRQFNLFSWDNGYICTGKTPDPPSPFIDFISDKLKLTRNKNVIHCPHLKPQKIIDGDIQKEYYLRIHWKSADWYCGICKDCTKNTKNTMFTISKYMLVPELSLDFDISIIAEVIKHHATEDTQTQYISEYLSGKLTDLMFIDKNIRTRKDALGETEEKILVLNGTSYGDDIQGFIKALKPSKHEIPALEFILQEIQEPLIIDQASSNKIYEKYWITHGKQYLTTVINDEKMVDSFMQLDETPSEILKFVREFIERQQILAQFPTYSNLPMLAQFIDLTVKTYLTFGKNKTLTDLKQHPDTPKGRSIAYAFFLFFKKEKDFKWKYTPEEIESGEFLLTYVDELMKGKPKDYSNNLQDLLTASGSNEQLPKK
jgi:hypothetical protein